jgi:hypothetical protein
LTAMHPIGSPPGARAEPEASALAAAAALAELEAAALASAAASAAARWASLAALMASAAASVSGVVADGAGSVLPALPAFPFPVLCAPLGSSHRHISLGQFGTTPPHCVWHHAVSTFAFSFALQLIGSAPGLRAEVGSAAVSSEVVFLLCDLPVFGTSSSLS